MFLFFYLLSTTDLYVTISIVGLIFVYQVYGLIQYVDKTNRDLARFLSSIKYEDFSQSFSDPGLGSSFPDLYREFSKVMDAFQQARAEKEVNFRYLQTIVRHIGVGLLCYQSNGEVELYNNAGKRLLNVPHLKNIKSLADKYPHLLTKLEKVQPGEKDLVKLNENGETLQIALYATSFKMHEQVYKLVSLQNIGGELEEREIEAWQNLTRVLAHEINNSVTPISSLASTIRYSMDDLDLDGDAQSESNLEVLEDIRSAMQTIEKRSAGLLRFVDAYRDLARIPSPDFHLCNVQDLLSELAKLMRMRVGDADITITIDVQPETLTITADHELIDQVIINLMTNAIQALENQASGEITLRGFIDKRGRAVIQVEDNGPGIKPELLEKIFVPFFTTKEQGSGIGLSFSRQIMRLHNGTISIKSELGTGTVATLRF
jgi:nitrogen fixation/metabolism regulation signal transduction histidine kinase